MGNIFRIFVRDCKRLVKAPAALIVVLALLVLPSIYTWYNVAAFWNPYENTGNLRVCVVNEDAGASTEMTGQLNVGDRIVDELLANEQLKWSEESRETALGMLEAGDVYAVYVIPEDFSACLVSPLTGDVKHPHLQYYVNEKLGPVSPKITDTAASTLEQTINSMFVSTVSDVSVNVIDESLEEVRASADEAQTKIDARVGTAKDAVENARAAMLEIQEATGSAKEKVSTALSALDSAASLVASAQTTLQDVSSGAGTIQTALSNLSSEAVPKLESVLVKTSQATSKAATLANGFAAKAGEAQSETSVAIGRIQPVINAMQSVGTELQNAADAFPGSTETQ